MHRCWQKGKNQGSTQFLLIIMPTYFHLFALFSSYWPRWAPFSMVVCCVLLITQVPFMWGGKIDFFFSSNYELVRQADISLLMFSDDHWKFHSVSNTADSTALQSVLRRGTRLHDKCGRPGRSTLSATWNMCCHSYNIYTR